MQPFNAFPMSAPTKFKRGVSGGLYRSLCASPMGLLLGFSPIAFLNSLETKMNKLDMKGRTAVVTGGAAGIGFAIAQRLVESGARVGLWDRDDNSLAAAAKKL